MRTGASYRGACAMAERGTGDLRTTVRRWWMGRPVSRRPLALLDVLGRGSDFLYARCALGSQSVLFYDHRSDWRFPDPGFSPPTRKPKARWLEPAHRRWPIATVGVSTRWCTSDLVGRKTRCSPLRGRCMGNASWRRGARRPLVHVRRSVSGPPDAITRCPSNPSARRRRPNRLGTLRDFCRLGCGPISGAAAPVAEPK